MITKWGFRFIVLAYTLAVIIGLALMGASLYLLYWLTFVGTPRWMS